MSLFKHFELAITYHIEIQIICMYNGSRILSQKVVFSDNIFGFCEILDSEKFM